MHILDANLSCYSTPLGLGGDFPGLHGILCRVTNNSIPSGLYATFPLLVLAASASATTIKPFLFCIFNHMKDKGTENIYDRDREFVRENFEANPLPVGEYEGCSFDQCNFAHSNLSDCKFIDCRFTGCNLSLTKLNMTAFREVQFKDCKMLGMRFDQCNAFGLSFSFEQCQLNHSAFTNTKIRKTHFSNCQLQEADFTGCDLTQVILEDCDLTRATFEGSILEKTDFTTANNYSIDPERNKLKGAKFSRDGVAGLLDNYDIRIV